MNQSKRTHHAEAVNAGHVDDGAFSRGEVRHREVR